MLPALIKYVYSKKSWVQVCFQLFAVRQKLLRTIQKLSHSGRRQEFWQKKWHNREEGAAKKAISLTQKFSMPHFFCNLFLLLCISWGCDSILVSNNKNIQKVILMFDIAISLYPQNYNSTILPIWLVDP